MIGRAAPLNSNMRRRDFINLLGGAGLLCAAKARRARAAADNSGGRFLPTGRCDLNASPTPELSGKVDKE